VRAHALAHRFQKFESGVDVVVEPTQTGLDSGIVDDALAFLRAAICHSTAETTDNGLTVNSGTLEMAQKCKHVWMQHFDSSP